MLLLEVQAELDWVKIALEFLFLFGAASVESNLLADNAAPPGEPSVSKQEKTNNSSRP